MKIETNSNKPFQFIHDYTEMLSVEENGDIKLRGKVIATDKEIADLMITYSKPLVELVEMQKALEEMNNF